jgi:hypothetical protein
MALADRGAARLSRCLLPCLEAGALLLPQCCPFPVTLASTGLTIGKRSGIFEVELSRLCIKFVEKTRHQDRVPRE